MAEPLSRNYLLNNTLKLGWWVRIIAKAIDAALVMLLIILTYPLGAFLGLVYWIFSDSLGEGQSIGKKLMGIKVISLEDGSPCSLKQSAIRNLPFIIPWFFLMIPFWGVLIGIVLGTILVLIEVYLLLRLQSGHRIGDVLANTTIMGMTPDRMIGPIKTQSWFET